MTDGRSLTARRFQDLFEDICADLGGIDRLSEGERQLVRRAATLSAEFERQEAEWANGRSFDIVQYSTTANCLRRILESLGLQRVPRPVDGPQTLADIARSINAQRQPSASASDSGGDG